MNKKEKLVIELINKQFEIAGHDMTYDKLKELGLNKEQDDPSENWYVKYTKTTTQAEEFREWAIERIAEVLDVSKAKADYEFSWWDLSFGLKEVADEKTFLDEEE